MISRLRQLGLLAVALAGCLAILAPAASANAPITSYSTLPSNTQAGGHPDVDVQFSDEDRQNQLSQSPCNCEDPKDALVHLPPGFIGNPNATPQCSIADYSADECAIDTQIGVAEASAGGFLFVAPVYNITPPPGIAGLIGFKIYLFDAPEFTVLSARTGTDYGLDATATSIFHGLGLPLEKFRQVLWGVPADPSHDPLRLNTAYTAGAPFYYGGLCDATGAESTSDPNTVVKPCGPVLPPESSSSPPTPFLQNPTTCDTALSSSLELASYDGGTDFAEAGWPQMTGCDQLSFNPSLYAQPTTDETDSASGIDVNLTVPQQQSPTIPSPSELRAATVTLPPGFSINPNAADGKESCSDSAARFGTAEEAHCPEYSKVGSLTIDSSALPGPLPGFVYLGEPLPGNRYRIFLVANGFAVHIKLAGSVHADPVTGQLVISFQNLPQSPLTAFNMHFFGSERGLLATPTQCGTYPVTSTFTPWDSSLAAQSSTQFFTLTSGPFGADCPPSVRPFNPAFHAASAGHTPGAHAPFSIELTRADGDQDLSGLTVATPPGFSATLSGVPYCSDSALAVAAQTGYSGVTEQESPSCPPASLVGTAVTGAGAGTHPLYVSGRVYLAGPYKGAPLSLAVITPAVSGPYDLGSVVVRVALHVNPTNAQITAVSDPLPLILEGVPLRLRSIRINLDRPGFTINPTNCDPFAVTAQVTGDQGAIASLSDHFQLANCATLPFEPSLSLRLSGSTKRTGDPSLHSVLTAAPGESGISSAVVSLPPAEILDNAHIGDPCTQVEFKGSGCPASSEIGFAKAVTPLLEKPLEGPVYLMTGFGHRLPDVVAALKGQIDINLDGRVDTVNKGLRTSFETVPDAPVRRFNLTLFGGSKGLITNSEDLCQAPQKAKIAMGGQNGKQFNYKVNLKAPCGASARHKRHRSRPGAVG